MVNQQRLALSEAEITALSNSVPPPPYEATQSARPGGNYDLTPTPHHINRPRLPEDRRNPYLGSLPDDVTIVKFQTIVREGKEIIVGRLKVPTSESSHAFILRRYDTQAISLTTMFKVAFPTATDDDEKHEMDWVRSSFDTSGTNGSRDCNVVRLAGQWVSRHLALHLSTAYGIQNLVHALSRAQPDPSVSYRKSQRSQAAADELARQRTGLTRPVPATTTPAAESQPSSKRRRTAEPATPSATRTATPAREPESVTRERRRGNIESSTSAAAPVVAQTDMESEIAEAKQLVRDLKRELQMRAAAGEELEDQGAAESSESGSRGIKRGAADDNVDLVGGAVARGERAIRTNRRVAEPRALAPVVKQAAFGAMLFGLGAAAAAFLPQVSQYAAQFL